MTIKAYGARAGDLPLEAMDIVRRAPGAQDVQIEIAYCGVCHSDLHQVRAEWAGTRWPCVPGMASSAAASARTAGLARAALRQQTGGKPCQSDLFRMRVARVSCGSRCAITSQT